HRMKLIRFNSKSLLLLLVVSVFHFRAAGNYLQQSECDPCQLEEALNSLSEHYYVLFSYKTNLIKDVEVSFEINEKESFGESLDRLLSGLDLNYKSIDSKYYLLYPQGSSNDRDVRKMERKIKSLRNLEKGTGIRLFRREADQGIALNRIYEQARIDFADISVEGTVISEDGEPLIGVNILVKGTNKGTTTDFDGQFSLSDVDENAVLVFSYIGYKSQEVDVSGRTSLTIILQEDVQTLDEVVVVGYGSQKLVNLTGSVGVITSEDLLKRPITNVSTGLQGLVPGLTVTGSANGGLPGQSNASLQIRGIGSRSNNSPLVLIDGAEGDMNIINPDDIESISVLKDAASAAIYGNRAANGVILITTKSAGGKERPPQINVNAYYGSQQPTKLPKMADSPTFMRWENEALQNVGGITNYSEADIQKAIDGTDPNYYGNTDWIKESFLSSAPQYNFNASINGKAKNMGYLLSYGHLDQEGLSVGQSTNAKRNNVRLKLNTKVADIFDVDANISYIDRKYRSPNNGFSVAGGTLYNAMRTRPLVPVRFTDGGWGYGGGQTNQVAYLTDGGGQDFASQEFTGNFSAVANILEGWTASANYITRQSNSFRNLLSKTIDFYYPETNDIWYSSNTPNSVENRDYRTLNQ